MQSLVFPICWTEQTLVFGLVDRELPVRIPRTCFQNAAQGTGTNGQYDLRTAKSEDWLRNSFMVHGLLKYTEKIPTEKATANVLFISIRCLSNRFPGEKRKIS